MKRMLLLVVFLMFSGCACLRPETLPARLLVGEAKNIHVRVEMEFDLQR